MIEHLISPVELERLRQSLEYLLGILDQLFSFVVAAIPTTSAAVARAIDELMRRPQELEGAQAAARAGDTALVGKYINEAMRFSPLGPGVFRTTTAEYTIGAGTMHATTIPAGTTVLVSLLSAMFDAERIDHPNRFLIDRPAWSYMPFGFGLHTCFGQYINAVQMPLIAQAILRQRNLRRAAGADGSLQFDGSFPSSLTLEFDP
jgi:cytochrome P450